MKNLLLILLFTIPLNSIAQEKKRIIDDFSLAFETEINTEKDDDNKIAGHRQYYRLQLSHKYKRFQSAIGVDYVERDFDDADKEQNRRDQIDNVFFKLRHNTASFKKNKIADLRLQFRYYYVTDAYYRERFGADTDYQLRAYYGRPIYGKFYISKYTSYLRYKKYGLNQHRSKKSREYELRARISPVYRPTKDLEFGITSTYNHKFTKVKDDEVIDFGISARKQFGRYAILFFTSSDLYKSNDNRDFIKNDDFFEETTFFLNFNALIF